MTDSKAQAEELIREHEKRLQQQATWDYQRALDHFNEHARRRALNAPDDFVWVNPDYSEEELDDGR
jgi:vacuolar-type H+-ATPase subunit E/Vma4